MSLLARLRRRRLYRLAADAEEAAWEFEPCYDCGAAWYKPHAESCPAAVRPHP